MKKIFFAAVFAGALLGFTSCGNREMVTGPEMETVIDSIIFIIFLDFTFKI